MPVIKATQTPADGDSPDSPATDPRLDWAVILDAPEISGFLKKTETERAKEYRLKTSSVLNTLLQFRLTDPNGLADVSAILQRGPSVALRAGELADANATFRQAMDVITAPDNPAVMFALATVPLVLQFFRNHEGQIEEARNVRAAKRTMTKEEKQKVKANRPKIEFRLLGRKFTLPFRMSFKFGNALRMNTVDPDYLTASVIGDAKVRAELTKRFGVKWGNAQASD